MKVNLRGVILLRPNVHDDVTLPLFVIYQCIYSEYSHGHFISIPCNNAILDYFFIPCRDTLATLEQKHTHTHR